MALYNNLLHFTTIFKHFRKEMHVMFSVFFFFKKKQTFSKSFNATSTQTKQPRNPLRLALNYVVSEFSVDKKIIIAKLTLKSRETTLK